MSSASTLTYPGNAARENFKGGYGYGAERAVPGMPPASLKNSECSICRSARGVLQGTTASGAIKARKKAAGYEPQQSVARNWFVGRIVSANNAKENPGPAPGPGFSVPRLHPSEIVATQLPNYLVSQTLTVRIAL